MIDPSIVIFAIQSGIKLGNKVHEVLVDKNHERPLILPLGEAIGNETANEARDYFREHPELTATGGPYHGLTEAEKLKAYRTILKLSGDLGDADPSAGHAREIILGLNGLEQVKKGFGARPAVQRILGTIAEIGIEYVAANPKILDKNSDSRKVMESFISHLDEINLSESTPKELVHNILDASLRTLNDRISLIDDDRRLQTLVGGITQSLIEDYSSISSVAGMTRRGDLIKRISSSVVRGGATAFTGHIDLFLRDDATAKALVKSTLSSVIKGIDGKEDLFTNESVELIFQSALTATSENSALFSDAGFLQAMIKSTVTALSSTKAEKVFGKETVSAIMQEALEVVRENVETLIDPKDPGKQLLAGTIGALANGLGTSLAGGGTVRDLLSKRQLVDLAKIAFSEVARNPEHLLDGVDDDERKTVLAQVVGSLAKALGDDPRKLVTGEGFLGLVRSALRTGVLNADKLLDLNTTNVNTNVLFQVTQQAAAAVLEHKDPRRLASRDVFKEIVERILPVVSANLGGLREGKTKLPVKATVSMALDLASDQLQNRVNGANLPAFVAEFLTQVLRDEVVLTEVASVTKTATAILNKAQP